MANLAMLSCWNHYHAISFVRDLAQFANANLVAVWDDDQERGAKYAIEFGIPFEPDLTALLARADIDGVIIDSAPEQAAAMIEVAAKAVKHILVDQVLALSLQQANDAAQWIKQSGIYFALDMSLKRWPVNLAAKQAVISGQIGEITSIRIRNAHQGAISSAPLAPRFLNGSYGVLTDLGAHCLYLMHWIMGLPTAVTAIMTNYSAHRAEDNAVCLLEFASGVVGICDTSYTAEHSPFSIELYGTKGSFIGRGKTGIHHKLLQPADSEATLFQPEEWTGEQSPQLAVMPETADEATLSKWLKAVNGEQTLELPYVEDGIALATLLEASYVAANTGQKVFL